MPFTATSFSIGAGSPTQIVNPSTGSVGDPVPVVVFNNDPAAKLFIGGPAVTSGNGFPVLPQTGISFRLLASDPIFAITAAGTIDTRVLIGRQ